MTLTQLEQMRIVDNAFQKAIAGRAIRPGQQEANPSVTIGPNTAFNVNALFSSYAQMSYMLPFEMLDFIELLAVYNPDYSQAVENMRTLANPGHTLFVDATKGVAKEVALRITEKNQAIQHKHGGIEGLIDKLLWQAAVYGAMAGEWVPNEDMTDIVDFIDVNPKTIRFFWELESDQDPFQIGPHWAPYQRASKKQIEEAEKNGQKTRNGAYIKLNELTFQYFSFNAAPGSPYGVPPFLAALNNIAIQRDMMTNMASVVRKLGLLGLIDIAVKELSMTAGESPEQFQARATQYLESYANMAVEMLETGGFIHFDDATVTSTNLSGNAAGATNIFTQNEEQVFSGLKSMPSVQGRCVVPETLVLTSDLRWVPAGDLELGDELIGFDEDLGAGRGYGAVARMKSSVVECVDRIFMPCYRVVTDKGEITVSENHPMVFKHRSQTDRVWRDAKEVKKGDKLIWFTEPWQQEESFDAGYLAGMFDGEASLGFHGSGKNGSLTFSQRAGVVLDETVLAMKRLGFDSYVGRPCGGTHGDVCHVRLLGGKWATMRFLGSVRPHRLLQKARQCWEGASLRTGGSVNQTARQDVYATVLKVEYVGRRKVVALQTSSRTFFSEGFLSHNSYSTTETYAGVAYDIMIRQSLRYQRAVKLMLEYGYRLMCMMWGTQVKSVKVQFKENKSLQRLQIAQSEHIEILNVLAKWAAGFINQVEAAHELGYPDVDTPLDDVPNSPWFQSAVQLPVAKPFEEAPEGAGKEDSEGSNSQDSEGQGNNDGGQSQSDGESSDKENQS